MKYNSQVGNDLSRDMYDEFCPILPHIAKLHTGSCVDMHAWRISRGSGLHAFLTPSRISNENQRLVHWFN